MEPIDKSIIGGLVGIVVSESILNFSSIDLHGIGLQARVGMDMVTYSAGMGISSISFF